MNVRMKEVGPHSNTVIEIIQLAGTSHRQPQYRLGLFCAWHCSAIQYNHRGLHRLLSCYLSTLHIKHCIRL